MEKSIVINVFFVTVTDLVTMGSCQLLFLFLFGVFFVKIHFVPSGPSKFPIINFVWI